MNFFHKIIAIATVWSIGLGAFATAQAVSQTGTELLTSEGIQEVSQIISLAELDQLKSDQSTKIAKLILSPEASWKQSSVVKKANLVVPDAFRKNLTNAPVSKSLEILFGLPQNLKEGGRSQKGYVKISLPLKKDLKFNVAIRNSKELSASKTVTIPAGKTIGFFQVSARNDKLTNLTRPSDMAIYIKKVVVIFGQVNIVDDEPAPTMKMILPPSIKESEGFTEILATLVLDKPVDTNIKINFSNNLPKKLFTSKSKNLQYGQKKLQFLVRINSDNIIHGDLPITLKAQALGITDTFATIIAQDNEPRVVTLVLPTTVPEGGTKTAKLKLSGTMGYALDVNLTSNRPEQIEIPRTVRIPIGESEVTFPIGGVDNFSRDGSRDVRVTATATDFTGSSEATQIRDNEVVSYRVAGLGDIVNISSPVPFEIYSIDIEGKNILNPSTVFDMHLVLPDGTVQSLRPSALIVSQTGGLAGNLTLPSLTTTPLKIKVTNQSGQSGESIPFDIMRVLPMTAQNMAWDPNRKKIYASSTSFSGSIHDNQIVVIDPENLQILAAGKANPDPVDIVIHNGGDFLYQSSRDGFIYKFNSDTLKILSQFSVRENAVGVPFHAGDFFPVEGSPDSLVVAIVDSSMPLLTPKPIQTVIFDSGVKRPRLGNVCVKIEPSSDPSWFYGFENSYFGGYLSRTNISSAGVVGNSGADVRYGDIESDFRSYADRLFANSGLVIDGKKLKRLGKVDFRGHVCPDTKSTRVFYLENYSPYPLFGNLNPFESISAYDPISLKRIARLMLPEKEYSTDNFIRWGKNGLAYRTATSLVFINSNRLVPSQPSADVAVTVTAPTDPVGIDTLVEYTIRVANKGPNIAKNVSVNVKLSEGQTLRNAISNSGTLVKSASMVTFAIGDLNLDGLVSMSVTTNPKVAGQISCSASLVTDSVDPIVVDNSNEQLVMVNFEPGIETFKPFKLSANNLVSDPSTGLLLAGISQNIYGDSEVIENKIVTFDPANGNVFPVISLGGPLVPNSMALSNNGRYLYCLLYGEFSVQRIDLKSTPPTSVKIPLATNPWERVTYYSKRINILDGDGTKFVVSDHLGGNFYLFEDLTRTSTGHFNVRHESGSNLAKTSNSNMFVSRSNLGWMFTSIKIPGESAGITQAVQQTNLSAANLCDLESDGRYLLSSLGSLIDSDKMTLISDLGIVGRPCVDALNQRGYLTRGAMVHVVDASTGVRLGTIPIPTAAAGDWARTCIRWGSDGLAILGDGEIFLARSALTQADGQTLPDVKTLSPIWQALPMTTGDIDRDGVPNSIEYLFGTSPYQAAPNPMKLTTNVTADHTDLCLTFPRRVGLAMPAYGYEVSSDLTNWEAVQGVSEKVVSRQILDGVESENVEAIISFSEKFHGFVRLRYLPK
jgi:Domain of unknown function DUF11